MSITRSATIFQSALANAALSRKPCSENPAEDPPNPKKGGAPELWYTVYTYSNQEPEYPPENPRKTVAEL